MISLAMKNTFNADFSCAVHCRYKKKKKKKKQKKFRKKSTGVMTSFSF